MMKKHVDREGYVHVETPPFAFEELNDLFSLMDEVVDFDVREDEDGFEFWHIKGVGS